MDMWLKKIILLSSLALFIVQIFYFPKNERVNKTSSIPKIYLVGDISGMESKEDERNISISYSSDDISFKKFAKIKIQGATSSLYEKKNYTIKLYDDDEFSSKYKVDFGWGKENKYVLKANWIDKTHSRNIVGSRLAASVSKKYDLFDEAPNYGNVDGFVVEVYINEEFLGLYTLNIPKDEWLLNMDKNNENHLIFEAQINSDMTFFKKKAKYGHWTLEVGEENDANLDKLNRLYTFISTSSDEEFKEYFSEYFNLDSVLNYYVLTDILFLCDNLGKNLLLVSYDGEVWYTLLYDLDTSFGTNSYGNDLYSYDQEILFYKSNLFLRFEEMFSEEIKERYFELRDDILTVNNISNEIDSFYNTIPEESLIKENERWENIPGYDISQMKEYIEKRIMYLDSKYSEK